jgi:TolB-like protein
LFVISKNSATTYKERPIDVKQVAEELGIQYVLEGSVRKAGDSDMQLYRDDKAQDAPAHTP